MLIDEIIESLKQAGPLNIVWGASCALAPKSYGIDWAHICLAELLRSGRVARLLTANADDGIVKATTVVRLLPHLYNGAAPELADCATPCIYSLRDVEPAEIAGLIERGAQTGAWLVFGSNGEEPGLRDALRAVPRLERGLYWIGHFDQPPPKALGDRAHFVGGFNTGSFLAYLLRACDEFPPAFVKEQNSTVTSPPGKQLYRWCHRVSESVYKTRDSLAKSARESLQKAAGARGPEYDALVSQGIREFEMYFRWSTSSGYAGAVALGTLAGRRSPTEAIRLLRKCLEWIESSPADTARELEARQVAETYAQVARFRTGAQADALFARAEQVLGGIEPGRLDGFLLEGCADVLCRWADQERNDQADAIFDRARLKFAEAQRLETGKTDRLFRYCQALRQRAEAVSGDRAMELLTAARKIVEELMAGGSPDAAHWQFLGMIAMTEAQKRPGPQPAALDEAQRCYREAIRLRPDAAGDLIGGLAVGLGLCGMERSGQEAIDYYLLADPRFHEAEQIKDSRALRKNWSSILLRHAHEQGGPEELWERARQECQKAEAIDPGSGAYNLACIAADLGDREGVERWLSHSAEYGQIMPLSHTLRDVNFAGILNEPWFRQLLDRIYDAGAPPFL